jgi:hypothetical protein
MLGWDLVIGGRGVIRLTCLPSTGPRARKSMISPPLVPGEVAGATHRSSGPGSGELSSAGDGSNANFAGRRYAGIHEADHGEASGRP